MHQHQTPLGKNDEWLTPPGLQCALGSFDLDPCAPIVRPWPTAAEHFTIEDDGLSKPWNGRVWCNPPFNKYLRPKWMRRMSEHNNGIMLVPAATETKAFYEFVWEKAAGVCFVKGRPSYYYVDGSKAKANCGSAMALVAYGEENWSRLLISNLGFTIRL